MSFISQGDFSLPFEAWLYWNKHFYVWSFQNGGANLDGLIRLPVRIPNIIIFQLFGSLTTSYFYIISSLLLVFLAFYLFCRYFLKIRNRYICLTGAFLFTFNPIFLGNLAKVGLVLAAAMLPLCLICLQKIFETKRLYYLIPFFTVLNISFIHPYTFSVNLMLCLMYFIFMVIRHFEFFIVKLLHFAIYGVIFLMLNAYFILPLLMIGSIDKNVLSQESGDLPTDYSQLINISNTKDIMTALSFSKDVFLDFNFYNDVYKPIYVVAAFCIYIIFLALYLRTQAVLARKDKRIFVVMMIGFLVLILLSTGTYLGIDKLLVFLAGMPGGWIYRSPLKWQLYIPLFLFSALCILMTALRKSEIRIAAGLLIILAGITNGYLIADISKKLLTPRQIKHFSELHAADLDGKSMLYITSAVCRTNAATMIEENAELNTIFTSKNVQIRRVDETGINRLIPNTFDFVLSCEMDKEFNNSLGAHFTKKSAFLSNKMQLYENNWIQEKFYAVDTVYALPNSENLYRKQRFAEKSLGKGFVFAFHDQPIHRAMTGLFEPFDKLTAAHFADGRIISEPQKVFGGDSRIYISKGLQKIDPVISKGIVQINAEGSATQETGYDKFIYSHSGNIVIDLVRPEMNLDNRLGNGSFESGLWQDTVDDCYAYDDNPVIDIRLNQDEKSHGKQSLQLEATRHIACTHTSMAVREGIDYLLNFDYQSGNAMKAGATVSFNDQNETYINEVFQVQDKNWQKYSRIIKAPKGATRLNLTLYSYPDETRDINIVTRYDNIGFYEVPDLQDSIFIVSHAEGLGMPKVIESKIVNPTKSIISVKGASKPFFLVMKDSYSPKWQLGLANGGRQLKNLLPLKSVPASLDHVMLNNHQNGWFVDIEKLCKERRQCSENADGSYEIELVAEYTPQRWFYIGGIISAATFTASLVYIVFLWIRHRRRKADLAPRAVAASRPAKPAVAMPHIQLPHKPAEQPRSRSKQKPKRYKLIQ